AAPTAAPTRTPTPTVAPTAAPTRTPTPTAAPTAAPTVAPTAAPTTAPTTSSLSNLAAVLYSADDLAALPTSGGAWTALRGRADSSLGTPNISNQDDATDINVMAAAFVYSRTRVGTYRTRVVATIKAAVGTENGGRTLALARNLPGYVIAATAVDLPAADPTFDRNVFRPWLRSLLTETLDGMTLRGTHERRPNNWGTHAGAARAAIALYLGDATELAATARVFRGWLGDRSAYAGFSFGELSWQCDPTKPVAVVPTGCVKNGNVIDGALPDEMRRGGTFAWPPAPTGYAWEGLQGAMLQAELLHRAGYGAWTWSDRALLRAVRFLYERVRWPATGDDEWQPWLIDARYATSYRTAAPAQTGKNFGWTDWLYGS
ncbi:MAG: alginate lyase family protein, partial [Candidatus Limnocylindrales bacterium]